MNLLAFDTSSSSCSVALKVGSDSYYLLDSGAKVHARRLLEMIDELLTKSNVTLSDIELLVCGVGPGSFTGLRVGVGIAQGLAYSTGLKVLGVNSLLGYISADSRSGKYAVAVDARMRQIYNAGFDINADNSIYESTATLVCNPDEVNNLFAEHHTLIGPGWGMYRESLPPMIREKVTANIADNPSAIIRVDSTNGNLAGVPNSENLLHWASIKLAIGELPLEAEQLIPLYVRDNVADKPKS